MRGEFDAVNMSLYVVYFTLHIQQLPFLQYYMYIVNAVYNQKQQKNRQLSSSVVNGPNSTRTNYVLYSD